MLDGTTVFVAAVFVLAGLVKGVIGLGLPTISMGLLAVVMTPLEAAAILIVPSIVTNIWQMTVGGALTRLGARLWPMMLAVCAGTWAGGGLMAPANARISTLLLGVALVIYAAMGLRSVPLTVPSAHERPVGVVVGALTGIVTAATGVFVLPAVPFLQTIGLEKEELVQALGLAFTVSTLALAVNVGRALGAASFLSAPAVAALAAAGLGMAAGQALRRTLSPATFRTCFFVGLLALGLYLVIRSLG